MGIGERNEKKINQGIRGEICWELKYIFNDNTKFILR